MTDIPHPESEASEDDLQDLLEEPVDDYNAPGIVYAMGTERLKLTESPTAHGKVIWLISFTDLMGIILTFFVLLFTMSENALDKKQGDVPQTEFTQTIKQSNQLAGNQQEEGSQKEIQLNKIDYNAALDLGYIRDIIDGLIRDNPGLQKIRMIEDKAGGRLIVTLPQDLLFEKGKADMNEAGREVVTTLTEALKNIRNGVEIVGHADPTLASRGEVVNWNVSLSRSLAVASLMSAEGYSRTLPVMGMSSSLYTHLPESIPQEKREAMSRRVDIVINAHDNSLQQRFGIGQ
jgi:chemotaxis protein MotB